MFIILSGNQTLSLFLFTTSVSVTAESRAHLGSFWGRQLQCQVSSDTQQSVVPVMVRKDNYREKNE